jgi:hypothetical protein
MTSLITVVANFTNPKVAIPIKYSLLLHTIRTTNVVMQMYVSRGSTETMNGDDRSDEGRGWTKQMTRESV